MRKLLLLMIALCLATCEPALPASILVQGGADLIGGTKYGNTWDGDIRIETPLIDKISLGGEFEYLGNSTHTIYGDLHGIGLLGEVLIRPIKVGKANPYVVGGYGYYHWGWDNSQYLNDAQIKVKLNDSWGYKVGAGLDYPISSHWSLNLEYAFYKADYEKNAYYQDGTQAHVIGDSIIGNEGQEIKIGMRYNF